MAHHAHPPSMPHVQSHEPYISKAMATTAVGIQANNYIQLRASIALPPPPPCLPQRFRSASYVFSLPPLVPPVRRLFPTTDDMSHRIGRVVSDLSQSNSRGATSRGPHQQSTTSNADTGGNVGKQTKQKLALLFSGVVAWTRSESSAEAGSSSSRAKSRKQQQTTRGGGGTTGTRRRGLDIVLAVRKYVAMVEQLFASYSGGSRRRPDGDERPRRPHTFTYSRGGGGGGASSRRHKGLLSSAPASLRGSPANSGHLSVGESVTKTPSEVSTMEELQSAIQAAIAHCKSSAAASDEQRRRKC